MVWQPGDARVPDAVCRTGVVIPARRLLNPWFLMSLTVIGDQLTKWALRRLLSPTQSLPLIPHVLHLTYVQNTGAAFGLFQGHPEVFVALSIAVSGWVCVELLQRRARAASVEVGLALILAGAVGNVIDRVRFGYVIDFLDVRVWPVFNVADSAITIGVGLLLWQAIRPSPVPRDR